MRETLIQGAERAGVPLTPDFKPSDFFGRRGRGRGVGGAGLAPGRAVAAERGARRQGPQGTAADRPAGTGRGVAAGEGEQFGGVVVTFVVGGVGGVGGVGEFGFFVVSSSSPSSSSSSSSSTSPFSPSPSMRVVQPGEKNFRTVLEDCLTTGTPLLIDWRSGSCDDLDPALDPVLEGRFVRRAGAGSSSLTVTLGDRDVDVAPGFSVSLATPCPHPNSPRSSAPASVRGLYGHAGRARGPAARQAGVGGEARARARAQGAGRRRGARAARDQAARRRPAREALLFLFFRRRRRSRGSLLDDAELVGVLAVTKRTAAEAAGRPRRRLRGHRSPESGRRRVQARCPPGAILYSAMDSFGSAGVNPMYATGLAQFCGLYDAAIADSASRMLLLLLLLLLLLPGAALLLSSLRRRRRFFALLPSSSFRNSSSPRPSASRPSPPASPPPCTRSCSAASSRATSWCSRR